MPQRAAAASAGLKKGRTPKAHKLPERFPPAEVVQSAQPVKKKWQLGDVIGQGGFGLIYKASDVTDGPASEDPQYVIKIEPLDNGPLFCEMHFYQRVAKEEMMAEWKNVRKLKYLAVPPYLGSGQHSKGGKKYRFLVMPRLGTDLHKIFVDAGRSFSEKTTFSVGLRMLDALEYIHDKGYAHADIKASNILLGYNDGQPDNRVYLVDYGLAYRYMPDGTHKPYKEDPKRAHDGTAEYASRDAHKGVCPSRRGDLEILGYCMLEWLSGHLPWEKDLQNKDKIRDLKIKYMNDLPSLMRTCFGSKQCPDGLQKYLAMVSKLAYDEKPDYAKLRQFLKLGTGSNEWSLALPIGETPAKGVKRKSEAQEGGPSPLKKMKSRSTPAITNGTGSERSTPSEASKTGPAKRGSAKVTRRTPAKVTGPSPCKDARVVSSSSQSSGSARKRTPQQSSTASVRSQKPSHTSAKGKTGTTRKIRRMNVASSEMAVQTSPGFGLKG